MVAVGRLELDGTLRRLTWSAMPRTAHDGVAAAISAGDCICLDANIARRYTDASGNLSFSVAVTKF